MLAVAVSGLWLQGCGGGAATPNATAPLSAGQVAPAASASKVNHYAASRFAEQATFGPTPALVAELRAKGFEKWIDEQFALPPSLIDTKPFLGFEFPVPPEEGHNYQAAFPNLAVGAPDQLRVRVTWSLSQFIVVSDREHHHMSVIVYMNVLQQQALGRYDQLLYDVTLNAGMGVFLNNRDNRPKSAECLPCAPNENYARELMQLFTLGVTKLKADGTPQRDGRGRMVETYTQDDVEQLARVLTGWASDPNPPNRPIKNFANWTKPMVPTTWPPERDSGSKTVLGKNFPAGQTQEKDLRDAIQLLVSHPNIAPFVATRMIQHLVKSDPSPAYVGRVASRFVDNGNGVRGDMKAVVKAVLLDTEARAGDTQMAGPSGDGKLREPFLHRTAFWRGLGCATYPRQGDGGTAMPSLQRPFSADSVFSFYAPNGRAPGSNLLAPEQGLLLTSELQQRLGQFEWSRIYNASTRTFDLRRYSEAGCQLDEMTAAYQRSPADLNDWLAQRYFRGRMPATLRVMVEQLARDPRPPFDRNQPHEAALRLAGFALVSPYFGAIK